MMEGKHREEHERLVGEPLRQARENVIRKHAAEGRTLHPAVMDYKVRDEYYRIVGHRPRFGGDPC